MNYNIPNKRVIQQRANFIYTWLTKLKIKAKKNNAVIFFEESTVEIDDIVLEPDDCYVKYSDFSRTRLFTLPDCDELLELSIPELEKYLTANFKLYKEIRV